MDLWISTVTHLCLDFLNYSKQRLDFLNTFRCLLRRHRKRSRWPRPAARMRSGHGGDVPRPMVPRLGPPVYFSAFTKTFHPLGCGQKDSRGHILLWTATRQPLAVAIGAAGWRSGPEGIVPDRGYPVVPLAVADCCFAALDKRSQTALRGLLRLFSDAAN